MTSLIGVVISLSFVVITGYVGQISLAQMMLAGISGFTAVEAHPTTASTSTAHADPASRSRQRAAVRSWPCSSGLLVALPALRVRGVHLAIVTFAFAVAMDNVPVPEPGVNGGFQARR